MAIAWNKRCMAIDHFVVMKFQWISRRLKWHIKLFIPSYLIWFLLFSSYGSRLSASGSSWFARVPGLKLARSLAVCLPQAVSGLVGHLHVGVHASCNLWGVCHGISLAFTEWRVAIVYFTSVNHLQLVWVYTAAAVRDLLYGAALLSCTYVTLLHRCGM